jgi:hypothetical protein
VTNELPELPPVTPGPLYQAVMIDGDCADEFVEYVQAYARAAVEQAGERKPDGYAYRYPDAWGSGRTVIEFSGGKKRNGSKPIEAIPYYFATPPAASAGVTEAMVEAACKAAARDADNCAWPDDYGPDEVKDGTRTMRAALTAALSAARGE